jgi:CheY-like chemotaxis protein
MSDAAGDAWCATYLPGQVQDLAGRRKSVVVAVRRMGAVLVLEAPPPKRAPLRIGVTPHPGVEPIWANAIVVESFPSRSDEGTLAPKALNLTEVMFEAPPATLTALFDREMAAAWRRHRVVIVDDDLMQLRLLEKVMPRLGLDPICISTSIGAAYVIGEVEPRLILLDLNMPALDGGALCKQLRANPKTAATPVLFLSGMPRADIERAARDANANGFIEKGADVNTIIAEIHRHLRQ